jgi:hypothetical protein
VVAVRRPGRAFVALLAAALALDLGLLHVVAGPGISLKLGFFHLRIHDSRTPIAVAATLIGVIIGMGWRDDRRRALAVISFAAVGAAAAIILARRAQLAFPLADIAVLELYTREALAGRLLVGPYSRIGWHHPGPMYFYVAAPIYALGGARIAALNAAALALSLTTVAIIVWTTARYAGAAVSAALLGATTLCIWRIQELIDSVWNPHVVLVPTLALVSVCAALSCGNFIALPLAAVLASFVMQTDIAVVPFASTVLIVALVAGATAHAREPWRSPAIRTHVNVAAWLMVMMWFFPAAEQMSRPQGNLTALWRFFVGQPGNGQVFTTALAAWASWMTAPFRQEFALATGATVIPEISSWQVWLVLAQVTAPVIAAIWAFRARLQALAWLSTLLAAGSIVCLWSATRIEGAIHDHEMFWLAIVGASNVGVSCAALLTYLKRRVSVHERLARFTAPVAHGVLMAVLIAIALGQIDRARQGSFPVTITSSSIPNFATSIRRYLHQAGIRKPVFRIDDDQWGLAAGILLELDRNNTPFAIEDSWLSVFSDRFRVTGDEDAELTIAVTGANPNLAARPGNVTVDASSEVHVEAIRIEPNRNR